MYNNERNGDQIRYAKNTRQRKEKLRDKTKQLLGKRRQLINENKRHTAEYTETNKLVRKMAKEDIKEYKEKEVEKIIQQN